MEFKKLDAIQKRILMEVADLHSVPEGAYNIRSDGQLAGRQNSANIEIVSKKNGSGIDIHIKPGTKNESVHIPVIMEKSGLHDVVYNDFFVGEDCDVIIVAGCGINNCGNMDSEHDGIHRFFVEKNAKVRYIEKHYGEGDGTGKRILNPVTEVYMKEGSHVEMEMVQIKGVDSTDRSTIAKLGKARWTSTATAPARTSSPAPSRATSPIRNSTCASTATRPAAATPSATPSSWMRDASSRSRSSRRTARNPR